MEALWRNWRRQEPNAGSLRSGLGGSLRSVRRCRYRHAPFHNGLMHNGHLLKFLGKSWRLKESAGRRTKAPAKPRAHP
jgi:hypothetical protein